MNKRYRTLQYKRPAIAASIICILLGVIIWMSRGGERKAEQEQAEVSPDREAEVVPKVQPMEEKVEEPGSKSVTVGGLTFLSKEERAKQAVPQVKRSQIPVGMSRITIGTLLDDSREVNDQMILELGEKVAPWNREEHGELLKRRAKIEAAYALALVEMEKHKGGDKQSEIFVAWRNANQSDLSLIDMRVRQMRSERMPVRPLPSELERVRAMSLLDASKLSMRDYPAVSHLAHDMELRIAAGRESQTDWQALIDARDRLKEVADSQWEETPGLIQIRRRLPKNPNSKSN